MALVSTTLCSVVLFQRAIAQSPFCAGMARACSMVLNALTLNNARPVALVALVVPVPKPKLNAQLKLAVQTHPQCFAVTEVAPVVAPPVPSFPFAPLRVRFVVLMVKVAALNFQIVLLLSRANQAK
jgi:hypothetical protein